MRTKNVQYFIKSELLCLFTTGYSCYIVRINVCVNMCTFIVSKFKKCKCGISIEIHVYCKEKEGKTAELDSRGILYCSYKPMRLLRTKLIDNTTYFTTRCFNCSRWISWAHITQIKNNTMLVIYLMMLRYNKATSVVVKLSPDVIQFKCSIRYGCNGFVFVIIRQYNVYQ